ncbi:MAG: 3-phosphoshikimate 1-carboxyvinyltransferase [Methanomicrobiales archaeon]|jgi:3-phosphoshikimate 1-carboxyvinyltransferase|nr:3-phosphoshikimate 1-carboxyvinyltransferase [Methanomicrobiales archaeon]
MRLVVSRSESELEGSVCSVPSKSSTHRAFILASLSHGSSHIINPLEGKDTQATRKVLSAMGVSFEKEDVGWRVESEGIKAPLKMLDCENSGTTLRIMTGVSSLLDEKVVLTGDDSLKKRPMSPLLSSLERLKVACGSVNLDGCAPVFVNGPMIGEETEIRGDISSQFISSLLIACPLKEDNTNITLTSPLTSAPYVDMTISMMGTFGVSCKREDERFIVPGDQAYSPRSYTVPGDYSAAAFPLAAGALSGSVTVQGLDPEDIQGDRKIIEILKNFGADVKVRGWDVTVSKGALKGCMVDMASVPDLFPIVATVATQAEGETILFNAKHLRYKESDRIATVTEFLQNMGAHIKEKEDGCVIEGPSRLKGTTVDTYGDHRVMMASAIAATIADGRTIIEDGNCHEVSYPSFKEDLLSLGAAVELWK